MFIYMGSRLQQLQSISTVVFEESGSLHLREGSKICAWIDTKVLFGSHCWLIYMQPIF